MDPILNETKPLNHAPLIAKIETVIESILDALLAKQPMSIPIRTKKPPQTAAASSGAPDAKPWREMAVSFPGKTNEESRRFGKEMKCVFAECGCDVNGWWIGGL
jgi:hypothetical protein